MKQQILVIHGGATYNNYKEYFVDLKKREVNLEKLRFKVVWRYGLGKMLGNKFDVFNPKMPNQDNAHYKEWKVWFEKIIASLNDELILVGHSLGSIFIAKYLAENKVSIKIKASILVAAPFDDSDVDEPLGDFVLKNSLDGFAKQGGKIYFFQSKDDKIVPFAQLGKYMKMLPKAKKRVFNNREHFNQESFPEIVKLIKNIN